MNDRVSVSLVYDSKTNKSIPRSVIWGNRIYRISRVGLHHTYHEGDTLYHVFSVISGTLFFRLVLNTKNLQWKLEKVEDSLIC